MIFWMGIVLRRTSARPARGGLRRPIAIIGPANTPSQRVAAKIGLTQEKQTSVFGGRRVIYAADI